MDFVLAAVFVCVTKNAQTNCECVSSQFIASKTQETHSRGNTVYSRVLSANRFLPTRTEVHFRLDFILKVKTMNPDQTAPWDRLLKTYAEKRADD